MSVSTAPPRSASIVGALCGPLFGISFVASDSIARPFAPVPLPMPDAPASESLRYYIESATAITIHSGIHLLSAVFLAVFALTVGRVLAGTERETLRRIAVAGGVLAAVALVASAVISFVTAMSAPGLEAGTVDTLQQASFYAGGPVHVTLLGVFAVGSCLIALRSRPWARGFSWFGLVSGVISILSLLALGFYYASPLILVGRFSHFAWAICIGVILLIKRRSH